MTRHFACFGLAVGMCVVAVSASAQTVPSIRPSPVSQVTAIQRADIQGIVRDDQGQPLEGVVVSALGPTTASVVSDANGRFLLRRLPEGSYLVRAHRQGYGLVRSQLVQVRQALDSTTSVALILRSETEQPRILAAGVGPVDQPSGAETDDDGRDGGEMFWRLRHLKRGVLKDAAVGLVDSLGAGGTLLGDSLNGLGAAVGSPTRFATSLLAEVPWNGQLDLLTSTSFDRPQDLLSMQAWVPRGVAFLVLEAPMPSGHWAMRGALRQGDLSSWVLAGSYRRAAPATHRYEAGLSYGAQRYLGGNANALASVPDGSRNAGILYAYDSWTLSRRFSVDYGAKYARYDYLAERNLFSPRAGVTFAPLTDDSLKIRATVAHKTAAPGADEFVPPSSGISLPPERTFSHLSRRGFVAERLDHVELAAEREWAGELVTGVRVFRQTVEDQTITLFGISTPGTIDTNLGHYYLASAGDFTANGWGVSVSRTIPGLIEAAIDYTTATTGWAGRSPDTGALSRAGVSLASGRDKRLHDLTTSVVGTVPVTDTRVFVIVKVNSGFVEPDGTGGHAGTRFDLQVTQSLPFMQVSGTEWEMLVGVRSLFRDDLLDSSIYDELLVLRSPKQLVGGVTVRF
jgi:hypothetical protein